VACAQSVAAAIFFIPELGHPFRGLMQISGSSLRGAQRGAAPDGVSRYYPLRDES
jgi:hypothetical protein